MQDSTLMTILIGADVLTVLMLGLLVLTMSVVGKTGRVIAAGVGYTLITLALIAIVAAQLSIHQDHPEWFAMGGDGPVAIANLFCGIVFFCLFFSSLEKLEKSA